jgi:hypothetical protein
MREIEPTSRRILSVWWLVFWRGLAGIIVISAVLGFLIGYVGGLTASPREDLAFVSTLASVPLGIGWSWVVLAMALRKQYREFRVAFVAPENPQDTGSVRKPRRKAR